MNESICFSVIIPHYRSFDMLRGCLESIPNDNCIQTIVVDDNSPDKYEYWNDLIADFPNVAFISLSENRGAGAARNEALRLAKGKWVLFMDSDDYFIPNAFEAFWEFCNVDADVIYFKATSIDLTSKKCQIDIFKLIGMLMAINRKM